ncbi:PQQ-dependent catabolism-associated CXXCW motif protein [Methylocystis iwaonis]|uniref:PQQ-dependent catabolism-associated CXXCW motif protein n=1 Tax=Methylocystis iwaonis TaxID=2885079 RepID=UPI002E7B0384|nr:PQQ-dependent catabolism-associated CXXCW motif protein [Methylocystis iwaonis]
MRRLAVAALIAAFGGAARAETPAPPPEPEGYRLDAYRAPVPATLKGAVVVDTSKAFDVWRAKSAVFVDALPHAPKPEGLPKKAVWREQPRLDIPGSIWLPDTGFGALSDATQAYFEKGLAKATGQDKKKALVFYCLTNCWMSWNAAKRAMSLGYSNVVWYPQGTDGWAAEKHPLEERKPEPRE